jgi:DNA-binding NtrC family response regulator
MPGDRGTVLCVDDEPNIVRALQWLLQTDFDVQTATSGQEALALVRLNDFDVVISDQRMPGMSGVELLREVRRASPRSIRILLTGYSDMQAILRSVNESEIYRFINKPWNISELPKIVEQAVEIARTQPPEPPPIELSETAPISADLSDTVLLIDDDPEMKRLIETVVGSAVRLRHAATMAAAVDFLNAQPISVIITETRVAGVDATRLVRLMKQRRPEVISVVFSAQADAEMIAKLINEGQIFRFMPKPVREGYLKLVINSALLKHRQLVDTPGLAERHKVEGPDAGTLDGMRKDLNRPTMSSDFSGGSLPPGQVASGPQTKGLVNKVSAGVRGLLRTPGGRSKT